MRIRLTWGDVLEPILEAQFTRVGESLQTLQRAEPTLPEGPGKERLRKMKDLHEFWLREIEGIIERRRQSRS